MERWPMRHIIRSFSVIITAAAAVAVPSAGALALSYSDFASSVSSQIGQTPSSVDIILVCLWLALASVLIYAAYKVTAARQRRAVDDAYKRMTERRRKPGQSASAQKTSRPLKPRKPGR